jgi:hypothetical protein
MLRTTRREIERAFRTHRAKCDPCPSASERLLLFYAVECGLKAMIMRLNNVETSTDLAEEFHIGHDIREGLKRSYAPARLTMRATTTQHNQGPQDAVAPQHLHQAFRYSVPIDWEREITSELQQVMEWLKERLG